MYLFLAEAKNQMNERAMTPRVMTHELRGRAEMQEDELLRGLVREVYRKRLTS
jgi:hypothetical protein